MNKRPKDIEEAIDTVDNIMFDYLNGSIAWNKVLKYIEQLERSEQELLNELERICDDLK